MQKIVDTLDRKTYPTARVIGYGRVSTVDQDPQLQIDAMHEAGVLDDNMFIERVSAMAKKRPLYDLAFKDIQPGDIFIVWKIDRLARSVRDLWAKIDAITGAGARFVSLTQGIDTQTAAGRLMISVIGAMAEFELDLTRERTAAGMAAQRARGKHVGRPALFTEERAKELARYLNRGMSIVKAAEKMKLSRSGIHLNYGIEKKRGRYVVTRKGKK
jgi:DNA invertase Pin-like site-specific DNA recombinase